ncbi:NHL repeat-containing protein [Lacisediminihabitans sp. FW035]
MSTIDWRYLVPDTADDPGWSHSGIAVTDSGVVIFAEPAGGGLVLYRPAVENDAFTVERRRVPLLEIHGIFYQHDERGEALWLADPGFKARPELGYATESAPGQVGRFDLSNFDYAPLPAPPRSATGAGWEPTSVVATRVGADEAELVIVADGYGSSLVHLYQDGTLVRTIDGSESGVAFACPHGVVVDDRSGHPLLVVADRGNRRLVIFELDGTFVRTLEDPLFTSPSSLALRGDDLLVTELDGALLAVNADGARALIETRSERGRPGWPNVEREDTFARPQLELGMLNSPHGIAVGPDQCVYLTEWVIGGRQLQLTLHDEATRD